MHPRTSVEDLEELSSLLQVPLVAGTVNRGGDVIGAGSMQRWTAFCRDGHNVNRNQRWRAYSN